MDGFAKMIKMKVGGSVSKAVEKMCGGGRSYKDGGNVDEKQDKALIKKAFKQHDEAEHDKEPTEIKLKKGGRSKKEVGTVKKFKEGGAIYGAKKDSKDLKSIKEAKESKPKMIKEGGKTGSDVAKEKSKPAGDAMPTIKVKPTGNKKAAAPSKGAVKPAFGGSDVAKEKSKPAGDAVSLVKVKPTGDKKADAPNKAAANPSRLGDMDAIDDMGAFKKGGKIKKFADGGSTGMMTPFDIERKKRMQAGMATLTPDMVRQLLQQMPQSQLDAAGMQQGQGAVSNMEQGLMQQGMPGQLPQGMGPR